jgi:hypothetical protein
MATSSTENYYSFYTNYRNYWTWSMSAILRGYGERWPYIVGGYERWSEGMPPEANSNAFYKLCDDTRHATMLEF